MDGGSASGPPDVRVKGSRGRTKRARSGGEGRGCEGGNRGEKGKEGREQAKGTSRRGEHTTYTLHARTHTHTLAHWCQRLDMT